MKRIVFLFLLVSIIHGQNLLKLNEQEYFEMPGLNVMAFSDFYPDGHQTGLTFIQHGKRTAANGDVRLEPTPGQWSPIPMVVNRNVDITKNQITTYLSYPDSTKDRKGFNPIVYPDFKLNYSVRIKCEGKLIKVYVDLEKPLPDEWVGKVGFNFELFPGDYFGKSFLTDNSSGIFNRQANGPLFKDEDGEVQIIPMAEGNKIIAAPEDPYFKITIESESGKLQLIDGRGKHDNGWFIVRSLLLPNKTDSALEWTITPNVIENWRYKPVVQISQVGYHPLQSKKAIIEMDKLDMPVDIHLIKLNYDKNEIVLSALPIEWGYFLRYKYFTFDFTNITDEGMYQIKYGDFLTSTFQISKNVFARNVWQPTVDYFLPVQMCHMRVNDRYRVWHGLCHNDDALMAPTNINHFDGYLQGSSTLTKYKPLEHVPNLNQGGWHDAGDYDLRIESQAETVHLLSLIYEEFKIDYDATTIDQKNKIVEIHQPDGKPDILQQIEHGLLSIINGYKSLGRLYRGIISPTIRQYTLLGDGSVMTNNISEPTANIDEQPDDNWVFTEINPNHELQTAYSLASASRVMKGFNDELANDCLRIAEELWASNEDKNPPSKIEAAVELFITTSRNKYRDYILSNTNNILQRIDRQGSSISRILDLVNNKEFKERTIEELKKFASKIDEQKNETPYGVPYKPNIWGAGWGIQSYGVDQYFLFKILPEYFPKDNYMNALNFILGCHPGENTSSFVSGVGAKSATVAYGTNRADWSYIPGGIISGTALIRPDLPELKEWPYFWQQTEYVLGGGTVDYLFLVLAAIKSHNK
ncbi:MAG: glycoside hydrolase family 9 protein [Melioribacteraceae bacterium]|jgi:hypothetical protein|nr:glycoside hydrolase family 9 protein [Melioribacteraceae bacterium]